MKVLHICTFQLIPGGTHHIVTLPPPMVMNVNGVIYPWTLTCKQSDYVWCEEGLLRQHAVKSAGFAQAHYVFSLQNPHCLPVVCFAHAVIKTMLISWRNVMSWKYITFYERAIALFLFSSPGGNFVRHPAFFIPPLEPFYTLRTITETCNWPDPVHTGYSNISTLHNTHNLLIPHTGVQLLFKGMKSQYACKHVSFFSLDLPLSPWGEQRVYQVCRWFSPAIMAWRCSKCSADQVCLPGCRQESDKKHLQVKRGGKLRQAHEKYPENLPNPACLPHVRSFMGPEERSVRNQRICSTREANMINIAHELEIHVWLP